MSRRIPVEPFYKRHEAASDIVYGRVVAIEPIKESIEEFREFSSEDTKQATLQIEKSWKGQKSGKISFVYNFKKFSESDLELKKKHISHVVKGEYFLLFLRQIDGKKIAQTFFGAITIPNVEGLKKSSDYQALELLSSGKAMSEAVKFLGPRETKAYEDSKK